MGDDHAAYMNRVQACRYLGITDSTLRDWEKRRGFPPPGRNGRWKRSKIDAYMAGDDEAPREIASPAVGDDQIEEIKNASAAYFSTHH